MNKAGHIQLIKAVRKRVADSGGWEGSFALETGLKRAQVDQWMTREQIPLGWLNFLKASLKPNKTAP